MYMQRRSRPFSHMQTKNWHTSKYNTHQYCPPVWSGWSPLQCIRAKVCRWVHLDYLHPQTQIMRCCVLWCPTICTLEIIGALTSHSDYMRLQPHDIVGNFYVIQHLADILECTQVCVIGLGCKALWWTEQNQEPACNHCQRCITINFGQWSCFNKMLTRTLLFG